MTDRRKFIKTSTYVAAGSLLISPLACTSKKEGVEATADAIAGEAKEVLKTKEIGVQVYSAREQLAEDFAGTMEKLAEIGYKHIEAYGLGTDGMFLEKMTPGDYSKVVGDLGMELVSTHCRYFTTEDAQKMIDASSTAGIKYTIIPSLPNELKESVDTYKQVADNLNKVGEMFKAAGLKFGYHNHAFEFEQKEGQIPLEIMLNETQPDLVTFEADLYWVTRGGANPMDLINKYPGRFGLFHVKDAAEDLEQTTVGTGIIDFETILNARETAGLDYYFVEDERTDDPFANLKANFDYLNNSEFG